MLPYRVNFRVQPIVEWTPEEHSRTSQTWERRMRSCVRRSAGTASGAPPLLGRNPEGRREKGRGENFLAFLLGLGVRWLATSASMLRVDSSPTATAALGVRVPPCDQMHRLRKRVTNVSVHRFESGHNWITIQTINFYLYGAKSHPKTSQSALDNQKKANSLLNESKETLPVSQTLPSAAMFMATTSGISFTMSMMLLKPSCFRGMGWPSMVT